jgi:hypothetical protein
MKKLLNGIEVEMTELEIQQLEKSRMVVWNKEHHIEEIKFLIQEHLDNLAISKDYDGIIDVPTEHHINSVWYEEAKELLKYSSNLWWKLEQYKENLTEETDLTAKQWLENQK